MTTVNVRDYVTGYEFRVECGLGYTPTPAEQVMLEDFGIGLIEEINESLRGDYADCDPADIVQINTGSATVEITSIEAYYAGKPKMTTGYRNYRGEWGIRNITPVSARYGSSDYHKEKQLLITAYDHDKKAMREFAAADFCGDNRPCHTDLFLDALFRDVSDHYDRADAIKYWLEGCFMEALDFLEPEAKTKLVGK